MFNTILKFLAYLSIIFFAMYMNLIITIVITYGIYFRNKEDFWAVFLLLLLISINGGTALFLKYLFKKYFKDEEEIDGKDYRIEKN